MFSQDKTTQETVFLKMSKKAHHGAKQSCPLTSTGEDGPGLLSTRMRGFQHTAPSPLHPRPARVDAGAGGARPSSRPTERPRASRTLAPAGGAAVLEPLPADPGGRPSSFGVVEAPHGFSRARRSAPLAPAMFEGPVRYPDPSSGHEPRPSPGAVLGRGGLPDPESGPPVGDVAGASPRATLLAWSRSHPCPPTPFASPAAWSREGGSARAYARPRRFRGVSSPCTCAPRGCC